MVGSLSTDGVTIKNTGWWKPKNTIKQTKMKTRSQNSCCIGRRADKSGPRPPVRSQAGVEKYASGINLSKDSLQGHENCIKVNS